MGNFWSIVDSFTPPQPITTILTVSMVALYIYQYRAKIPSDRFAFLYDKVVDEGEWYRCLSATFSHLGIFHIIMNMITLWLFYWIERYYGSLRYTHDTLLLVVGTQACQILIGWLFVRYKPSWLRFTNGAGYSGVLFGWLTIYSMIDPMGTTLGVLPNFLLPWIYLVAIQVLFYFQNISFIGHLSGIVLGYCVSLGVFAWWDWYASLVIALWLAVMLVFNLKTHSNVSMPWLTVSASIGSSTSGRRSMAVIDGRIQRPDYANRAPFDDM